jgi:predicted RecA/RadA family phage recombinase
MPEGTNMDNYTSSGDILTVTAGEAFTSGRLYDAGNGLYGVAQADAAIGALAALVRKGRFTLPVIAGFTCEKGDPAYFDPSTAGDISSKAYGPRVGQFAADLLVGDATADVILDGEPGTVTVEFVAVLSAVGGKAIGAHAFGPEFPIGARVVGTWINTTATFTSATDAATIAIGWPTDDASGVDVAIAISDASNPWDAGFRLSDTTHAAPSPRITARRQLTAVVAVEALTAGETVITGQYVVTPA